MSNRNLSSKEKVVSPLPSKSIASLIDNVAKKLKLSKSIISQLIMFVSLVFYRIKDAYLVDACFITQAQARILVDAIGQHLNFDGDQLCVVAIGDDCFIVHKTALWEKLDQLIQGNLAILVVDLDSSEEFMTIKWLREHTELCHGITTLFSCDETAVHCRDKNIDMLNNETFCHLGAPLIAGFLLGYPVIYHASCKSSLSATDGAGVYSIASNKLSFTTLRKVIFSATRSSGGDISILEFTYPAKFHEDRHDDLQRVIHEKLSSLQMIVRNAVAENIHDDVHMIETAIETQMVSL